ncbi:MAG TPA: hypothetical protein VII16_17040 [Actinomycetes bacterium]
MPVRHDGDPGAEAGRDLGSGRVHYGDKGVMGRNIRPIWSAEAPRSCTRDGRVVLPAEEMASRWSLRVYRWVDPVSWLAGSGAAVGALTARLHLVRHQDPRPVKAWFSESLGEPAWEAMLSGSSAPSNARRMVPRSEHPDRPSPHLATQRNHPMRRSVWLPGTPSRPARMAGAGNHLSLSRVLLTASGLAALAAVWPASESVSGGGVSRSAHGQSGHWRAAHRGPYVRWLARLGMVTEG